MGAESTESVLYVSPEDDGGSVSDAVGGSAVLVRVGVGRWGEGENR